MLLFFCSCFLLLLYFGFKTRYNHWKNQNVPFAAPFLIFGNLYEVVIRKEHLFKKVRTIYNNFSTPYVGIFFFHKPALLVRSPTILKNILIKDFENFANRDLARKLTADPLAFYTLFFMRDEEWRNLRGKFSGAFTSATVGAMLKLMQERGKKFCAHLEQYDGKTVEMKALMKRLSTDVTASCALGVGTDCFANEKSEFFEMTNRLMDPKSMIRSVSIFSYFFMHAFVKMFNFTFADRKATDYLGGVFQKVVEERKKGECARNDFVDVVIGLEKKHEVISDDKKNDVAAVLAQVLTFFGAGTDTIGIILAFTFFELAQKPEIQDKLRKHVRLAFEENSSIETIHEMKYLDMVVNESLRKYPLAGILLRTTKDDYFIEETGFTLRKGTSILVPVSGLHYDPEFFPNPDSYDPERFNEENKSKIPRYVFLPFGDGPRHCIGKKFAVTVIKLALALIVKDFEFETTPETVKSLDFDPASTAFVQNRGGLFLKVRRVGETF